VLPFYDRSFDIVNFGLFLYLRDSEYLLCIVSVVAHVLRKQQGWLMLLAFLTPVLSVKIYHRRPGVLSYKMDYRTMFNGHPDYECMTHNVLHHSELSYTFEQDESIIVSIMRKYYSGVTA